MSRQFEMSILGEQGSFSQAKGTYNPLYYFIVPFYYEGESIGNQPNLFPVEIHLFFFDIIVL